MESGLSFDVLLSRVPSERCLTLGVGRVRDISECCYGDDGGRELEKGARQREKAAGVLFLIRSTILLNRNAAQAFGR